MFCGNEPVVSAFNILKFFLKFYRDSLELISPFLTSFATVCPDFVFLRPPIEPKANSRSIPNSKVMCWLLLCNAQSVFYKMDELRATTFATKPNVVCVTESWLTPEIDDCLIQIDGYVSFRNDRQDDPYDFRRGGGTVTYVSVHTRP